MTRSDAIIAQAEQYSARNYDPLPVVIERGEGVWVCDVEGNTVPGCVAGIDDGSWWCEEVGKFRICFQAAVVKVKPRDEVMFAIHTINAWCK